MTDAGSKTAPPTQLVETSSPADPFQQVDMEAALPGKFGFKVTTAPIAPIGIEHKTGPSETTLKLRRNWTAFRNSTFYRLIDVSEWHIPWLRTLKMVKFRSSNPVIIFSITMAVFTDVFLYGIVVPVIPFAFSTQMGVPEDQIQNQISRALALYAAGLVVLSVLTGVVADHMKRRRPVMLFGLLLLIAATAIVCWAKSPGVYDLGRFIQGASGGIVWVSGLAILADASDSDTIGMFMGFPDIGMSLGTFVGPTIGGAVYDKVGYNAVFYVSFGVLGLDVILRLIMLERSDYKRLYPAEFEQEELEKAKKRQEEAEQRRIEEGIDIDDWESTMDTEAELGPPPQAIMWFQVFGRKVWWQVPPIILLLRHPRILVIFFQSVIFGWCVGALDATLPMHLDEIFGFGSLQSGLVMLALAIPSLIGPVVGMMVDRFGVKFFATLGFICACPCFILLRLPDHHNVRQVVLLCALLALLGASLVILVGPVMTDLASFTSKLEKRRPGFYGKGGGLASAFGLFNVAFSIGIIIGPLQAGATKDKSGWGMMVLSVGLVSVISAVPTFLFSGGYLFSKSNKGKKLWQRVFRSPNAWEKEEKAAREEERRRLRLERSRDPIEEQVEEKGVGVKETEDSN
ncbi:putative MFS-type transporter C18.02 [Yarrowia sp. B02]|nr:putative MFS-type transporter C18.02 [Yarrowia sp. B02]